MNANTKKASDFLVNLGLSKLEAQIYLKLLEHGRMSVTDLAKELSMNRVTLHFNLERIIEMGLVTHVKQGRSKELTAALPDILKEYIDTKQEQIKELVTQYQTTLPLLKNLIPSQYPSTSTFDIKYFHGIQGIRSIYKDAYESTEICSFVNIKRLLEMFPETPDQFSQLIEQKKITMREIVDCSADTIRYVQSLNNANYSFKCMKNEWNEKLYDQLLYNGKIAIITLDKEFNGIIISSHVMYQNSKIIFDTLWNLLPNTPRTTSG